MQSNGPRKFPYLYMTSDPRKQNQTRKWLFRAGCTLACTSVIVASLGGHQYEWSAHKKTLFATAVNFSFFSSIGAIISSLTSSSVIPFGLFLAGYLGFSVPIWYKSWTDSRILSKFLPYGGVAMFLSWAALAIFHE